VLLCLLASTCNAAELTFIDTSFENASPLHYQVQEDGVVQVYLLYDHERDSPNRAAGHWHFKVEGKPKSTIRLVLNNFYNVWNGTPGFPISDKTITYFSTDGKEWTAAKATLLETKDRVQIDAPIGESGHVFVARLPPYRISDLDRFLNSVAQHKDVEITTIGHTVQGRPLEIVRVGKPDAPNNFFLRARAHPWEPGGNWVLEGMVEHLLRGKSDTPYFDRFCLYLLPMANKDGVANGRTRFNMLGRDLNRNWDVSPDPQLCPENHFLEQWLLSQLSNGKRFRLALELHNDERGLLHISRPEHVDLAAYLAKMNRFESLLRELTWFREGSTQASFKNPGSLGEGWLTRFGTDAVVHELNCNWIEGLQQHPSAENWKLYGRQLCDVFWKYCE
jgi:hypothetical protein